MFNMFMKKQVVLIFTTMGLAGLSLAAPPLQHKITSMECAERSIAVEADCFAHSSFTLCTQQLIRFTGADGKTLSKRVFQTRPLKNSPYPVVEERFGELNCVETKDKKRYLVASMTNGGNCEQCEWNDVYSTDGVLIGTTRNTTKNNAAVESATDALYVDSTKHVLKTQAFTKFYQDNSAR
jgi:hypothetical protein